MPFRDEADHIGENKSAELAFNEFLALHADMKCHHEKLLKMLETHNKVIEINNAQRKFEDPKDDDKSELEGVHISEATAAINDVNDIDSHASNDFDSCMSTLKC